jgi:Uma2 family endonuclease
MRAYVEESVRIPAFVRDHASFRRWARSDAFPERGHITWIGGEIEVDMSPEDIAWHGRLKLVIARTLDLEVERRDLGLTLIDSTLYSSERADLSCEPDVLVCFWETLDSGKARLVPSTKGGYREIEGAVDLVVEVVSDSSVTKDKKRLRDRYFKAGVREYWLVDARDELSFLPLERGARGFAEVEKDAQGFARSRVLGRRVRLTRKPDRLGLYRYRVELRAR